MIQQEKAVDRAVVHVMPAQRGEGRLAVCICQHRDRGTAGCRRGINRAVVHLRVIHGPMVHALMLHSLHAAMIHLAVVHGLTVAHRRMIHFVGGEAGRSAEQAE
ncbi:hypothetical protein D3C77_532800 [compost metagenome]